MPKLLLGEEAYIDSSTGLQTADFLDTQGPKWSDDEIVFSRVSQTQLDILWGHVTDNLGITTFNFYYNKCVHSFCVHYAIKNVSGWFLLRKYNFKDFIFKSTHSLLFYIG